MSLISGTDHLLPWPRSFSRHAMERHWVVMVAAAVLLLAAPCFALASWLSAPDHGAVLFYALPVMVAEVAVIILAIAAGFDIRETIAKLHPVTRLGAGIWLTAILFANLIAAPVVSAAIPQLITTLVHAIFAMALWSMTTGKWSSNRGDFLRCSAIGAAAFGVVFVTIVVPQIGNPDFNWIGVGIGITNIRQFGFYGVALVGITAGFAASNRGRHVMLGALALAFGFWIIILSGSRVAFAAALIAAIVVGVFSESGARIRLAGLVSFALLVAIPTSYLVVPHEAWGFDRIIDRSLSGNSLNEYASGRLAIWQETWSAILQNPLLGHGEGQFRSQIAAAGNGLNHPHNAILQYLYQWGLIGTAGLVMMLVSTARNIRIAMRRPSVIDLAAVGAAMGLVAVAMLEGALYHVYPVMIVVLSIVTLNASTTVAGSGDPRGSAKS